MKLLAEFSIGIVKTEEALHHLLPYLTQNSERAVPNAAGIEQIVLQVLLCDRSHQAGFDTKPLIHFRYFCIAFAVCYRSKHILDTVSPNAIFAYLRGA